MLKTRLGAKVAIIFFVLMIAFIVGPIFSVTMLADVFNYLIYLGLPVLVSCIAFVLNKTMYKLGIAKLNRL